MVTDHDATNIYCCFSTYNKQGTHHFHIHPPVLYRIVRLHQHHTSLGQVVNFRMLVGCDPINYIGLIQKLQVGPYFNISKLTVIGTQVKLDEIVTAFLHPLDSLCFLFIQNGRGHKDLSTISLFAFI